MTLKNNILNYSLLLRQMKQRVAVAQQRAIFAANEELLRMYWDLGQMLNAAQQSEGWGKGTLIRISEDMKNEYPEVKGFSVRNFQCMMQFYEEYDQELTMVKVIAQPAVAQLPKYNFTLPVRHITDQYDERDVEIGLVQHVEQFLVEMGAGFAFMGRQYHITVSDDDYYIDLLMYNTFMHRYMVIELKDTAFKPEYIGKLNFYCSAVDDLLCREGDNQTIGLLLCKTKDKIKAEYALRDINKPIGISDYELGQALPDDLKSSLPSIAEIEAEFDENNQNSK
ncbi:MAG: DUF1016 family protein [Bacteroidales bacterium]|nr:DUF1016 family protein [Bacteroidales bacterium]